MNTEPFLKPRLTGARFDGGVIPLEILADFAVLAEMMVKVAKWKYREDHPLRKRVSRGFTDGIALKLAGVEGGSAKPVILLVAAATNTLLPAFAQAYFEDAREAIIGAIAAAEGGQTITKYLPPKLLGYFERFGRNLADGEAIEFMEGRTGGPARLTRETRRTLIRAASADGVTNNVVIYGMISEMDHQTSSFHIRLADGTKVKAPLNRQHFDTVLEAFNNYHQGMKTRMHASGRLNRANRLQSIEAVEHIHVLDPLDVDARLDELKLLKTGWLDGSGDAPSHAGLDWFAAAFNRTFPDDLPLPHLYPTAEGGVRAEWSISGRELSLDVTLTERSGHWHSLDMGTDAEYAETLFLSDAAGWNRVADLVRLAEVNA